MIVNKSTLDALSKGFQVIFDKALTALPSRLEELTTRVPSGGANQAYPFGAFVAMVREWLGDKVVTDIAAWSKTITNKDWEFTFGVDRNHIEDDQLGVYNPIIQGAAQNFVTHPMNQMIEILQNDAFGTAKNGDTITGFDGVAFFNASHTWAGGYATAQSNLATGDLTETNVDAADVAMAEFIGPNGDYLNCYADKLVIGTGLRATARALFDAEKLSSGASNTMYGRFPKADRIVHPGIGAGRWIMLDTTKPVKPVIFQVRKAPVLVSMTDTKDEVVFMSRKFRYGGEARYAMAALPWWLAYASDGSTTTTTTGAA